MRMRTLMGLAVVAGWAGFGQAAAAEPSEGGTPLEEVVVTGSRIASPNLTSTSPIQIVTARDIQLQGKTDVIDILNTLPQNFQNTATDFSNTSNSLSTPGGLTTADLRGIGPQRTLVLVDGRRLGSADANTGNPNPAPDLDQIPVALIERVDVVTGGASATYGSDAIAGVVNFIMKKNFQGLQIDGTYGLYTHDNHNTYMQGLAKDAGFPVVSGSERDGANRNISVLAGTNIADGKGNVTAWLGYLQADPVTGADRDFSSCQLATNLPSSALCVGSPNSNYFKPTTGPNANTIFTVVGSKFLPWPQAGSNPPAGFNSNQYIYMSRQDQRYTAGFIAHIDVNEYARPYAEFNFMNDKTHAVVAPSALFRGGNPFGTNSQYDVNCSNPLLSAQQQGILCTPAQVAADAANPGSVTANIEIGRRNVEGGGRDAFFEHTNYRGVAGIKGQIVSPAWTYDAYGQYYYTTLYNSNTNYLNYQSVTNALLVTGTAAAPRCISGGGCVPYNIFKEGGVNDAQLASLYTNGTAYGTVTQRTVHADVTGELSNYGVKSPFAADGVAVNVGFEHRSEHLLFSPDAAELAGDLAGFSGASVPIDNGYTVKETFAELRVPIAQHVTGIQDLLFDTGFRRSDYSTAGPVNTYKFEVQYAPTSDLRFRGAYQRAIRAPNIIELFTPQAYGQQSFLGIDPCAPTVSPTGQVIAATAPLAQCVHTGVTAAQYGNGGTTNTVPQCAANQCGQVTGGNPDLHPEKSDSYTFGLTVTPSFLPNFSGSLDYYSIKIKDEVSSLPGAYLFQQCLQSGNPIYCSQIVRTPAGGLSGASVGGGGYILQTSVNIGAAKVSGIDVQANYKQPLPGDWGSLVFALNGARFLKSETTPFVGAHTYDCAGLFGTVCQTVNPKWRHNLRIGWDTPWNVLLSAYWRYIGSVSLDQNSADPSLQYATLGAYDGFNARLPAMSYVDLAAIWSVRPELQVRAGINNLFDKDPPLVATEISGTGSPNTYPTYDTLGRQLFLSFTAKF